MTPLSSFPPHPIIIVHKKETRFQSEQYVLQAMTS